MSDFNKILSTLSIASSDTREESVKSIVLNTLFESITPVTYNELKENISTLYDIELYEPELKTILKSLEDGKKLIWVSNGYCISEQEKNDFKNLDIKIRSEERKRYVNFKSFIDERFNDSIKNEDVKVLWQNFREYLYNSFFHYGIETLAVLNPKSAIESPKLHSEVFYEALKKLHNEELKSVFKVIVDSFSDYATEEDIDFINDLGQKALCFASLGLAPDDISSQIDFNLVDWILYLDTNFLFSILNLHVNVENEACHELLKLILENKTYLNIQFRYSELTLKELKNKKKDFLHLEEHLTKSGIEAILESGELDSFDHQYYQSLLDEPKTTLHPSKVVDLADMSLNHQNIKISRNHRQIESLGDKFIDIKMQDYLRYINDLNDYRSEYRSGSSSKPTKTLYRSDSQLRHDVILREMILSSRSSVKTGVIQTFNNIKYFGVTLDDLLIKYDTYEVRKSVDSQYPTFFKPSFLLNQLVKILPVKTENYKKAFIKAVSARGFNKDPKKSDEIIKVVAYLKSLGIDNKNVLLNLISEKLFMDGFRDIFSEDQEVNKEFIESELNRILNEKNQRLVSAEHEIENLQQKSETDNHEKLILSTVQEQSTVDIDLLNKALKTLKKRLVIIEKSTSRENNQGSLNFQDSSQKQEIERLSASLNQETQKRISAEQAIKEAKRNEYIKSEVSQWRKRSWRELIVCMLIMAALTIWFFYTSSWDLKNALKNIKDLEDNSIVTGILGLVFLFFNVVILNTLVSKYRNHSNINAFIQLLVMPEELR